MRIEVGRTADYEKIPALVEIGRGFYYLCRRRRKWFLLSTLCPHQGGEVIWSAEDEEFVCPLHGWRFDARGRIGPRRGGLKRYPVEEADGVLWVQF